MVICHLDASVEHPLMLITQLRGMSIFMSLFEEVWVHCCANVGWSVLLSVNQIVSNHCYENSFNFNLSIFLSENLSVVYLMSIKKPLAEQNIMDTFAVTDE